MLRSCSNEIHGELRSRALLGCETFQSILRKVQELAEQTL
jgi:hypothetical protein